MTKIIETHCHLDYLKNEPLADILKKSEEAGIEKIITIAVEPDNFDAARSIAENNEKVYFSQGIHPHDAKLSTPEALKTIESRVGLDKMVAVGEIGLDYHYDNSPRDIQKDVFRAQLDIAIRNDKPVIIHSRDADEDMIEILSEKAPELKRKGVIHSFTSGPKLAQTALDLGFYLGFNGIITFKKAQEVRDIVDLCPIERILTETDSPFLTPTPHRGKENAPYYLPFVVKKIAEIKNLPEQEVLDSCYRNAFDLFKF